MWFKRNEQQTYLIVGLGGNPGAEYRLTRHNFGFMVLDALAEHWSLQLKKIKFNAVYVEDRFKGNKVVLAKPLTFMNESGRSVAPLMRYFKVPTENMLVIHDDLDLPLGTLRIRPSGSSGGQRGIESITKLLGTQEFPACVWASAARPDRWSPRITCSRTFCPTKKS